MTKTTRNIIIDVLNTYGNAVPEQLKMNVAHEIAESLVDAGLCKEDEPKYVEEHTAVDAPVVVDMLQDDAPNQFNVADQVTPAEDAPVLTPSDVAYMGGREKTLEGQGKKVDKKHKTVKKNTPKKAPSKGLNMRDSFDDTRVKRGVGKS